MTDDWVVLAPSRWKLRRAIKAVNKALTDLKVHQHPDKTFIGRITRGFDFLGYSFSPKGLGIATKTIERFLARITRLYERDADAVRIGEYVRHWLRWVRGGVRIPYELSTPPGGGLVVALMCHIGDMLGFVPQPNLRTSSAARAWLSLGLHQD